MQVQLVKTPLKRGKLAEPIGGFWSSLPLGLRHAFELICLQKLSPEFALDDNSCYVGKISPSYAITL